MIPSQEASVVAADRDAIVDGGKGNAARFDPLADLVVRRWHDAQLHRQQKELGDCTVEEVLGRCYRQRESKYDDCDRELLDGIDIYIPLTDMKCVSAEAWLRDMLSTVLDMPFTIEPTPIPSLPERMRAKVLRDLKVEIAAAAAGGDALAAAQALAQMPKNLAEVTFGGMIAEYPGDLYDKVAGMKQAAMALAFQEASKASEKMGILMRDQLIEMNFAVTLNTIFSDMVTYPAAILKGPIVVQRPQAHWSGNTRTVAMRDVVHAYRVSPFDIFPSADSPDTQRGTFIIERGRMTRRTLKWARNQKFWIREHLDRVLTEYRNYNRNWLMFNANSRNLELPTDSHIAWGDDETIEMLEHHGILSGAELRAYGFSASDDEYYEAKVIVCGGRTLYVKVNGAEHVTPRPYHNTSYHKLGDQFWNRSPTMKLRDVQRTLNSTVRAKIRNMSFSSGPIGEIDVQRTQRYVKELKELLAVDAYSMLLTDPDPMSNGRPARQFQMIPNIIAPLLQTMQFYWKLADDVSNIPAYAQGDTGLGGAGRTYRGFSAVFSQALKVFKMPVQNLDTDVFEPFARALYDYNMATAKDPSVLGDSQIRARGSRGLVDMEQQQQKALEAMQVVTQMSPAVAQIDPEGAAKVLRYTWAKAMQALGVPMEAFGVNPDVEAAISYGQATEPEDYNPSTIPPVNAQTPPPT